jgi:hypothetical protein
MPSLLLSESDSVRVVPLAPATLVGRAAACLARVSHESCPAHWLELRWRADGWTWRALAAVDRTYGAGAFVADGWRTLDAREGQGTRVRLIGTSVHMELVEGGAPRPFAWDVLTDEPLDGDALTEVAEVRGHHLLPLAAEGDATQSLRDGQCWVHTTPDGAARTLRAHVPDALAPTLAPRMDLARPGVSVEIDLARLEASFTHGDAAVGVRGECVRALAVFALARRQSDGWLDASEAWARWVELGGRSDTALDRMSWERGKLRAQLARQRVTGLDGLFERRKTGAFVRTRLALDPAAVFVLV